MRRIVTGLVAAAALSVGLFVGSPIAKSNTGPFDFNLEIVGTGAAGTTMTFLLSEAHPEVHFLILASPNQEGMVIDPFRTPLGDAPPFNLCVGRPTLRVATGRMDSGGFAIANRRVPPTLHPQAAGRVFYFQAYYVAFNGMNPKGFVSDVETALIHY